MRYRRLDENWDFCMGRGVNDYLEDSIGSPDAIQQAIKSSLLLLLGEWWENTQEGLPLWQKILGKRTSKKIIDNIIVTRIRELKLPDGSKAILNVSNVNSTYSSTTREYNFSCVVDTAFGKLVVSNGEINRKISQSPRTAPAQDSSVTWQGDTVTWQGDSVTWQGGAVAPSAQPATWQGDSVTWQGDSVIF